jgi:hypothetical protein
VSQEGAYAKYCTRDWEDSIQYTNNAKHQQNQQQADAYSLLLGWEQKFIKFQKLLQNGIMRLFHLFHGAKKQRFSFMQKNDTISEFFRKSHVMCDDDTCQVKLLFQTFNQIP